MESGIVMMLVSTMILIPSCIWITCYQLHKKLPKLFVRLDIEILLCLLGIVSLLITDAVGHVLNENFANHS